MPGSATAFGGVAVPCEAAGLGCERSDSDLNPVGRFLTWGLRSTLSARRKAVERVRRHSRQVRRLGTRR